MSRAALKTAARVLIQRLGGIDAAATCTRVGRSNLAEYGSLHHPDRHMPVDVVADLEMIAGEPLVTAALARAAGFTLVPLALPAGGDAVLHLQRVARQSGTVLSSAVAALSDGTIDADEREALLAQLDDLRAAVGAAMAALAEVAP